MSGDVIDQPAGPVLPMQTYDDGIHEWATTAEFYRVHPKGNPIMSGWEFVGGMIRRPRRPRD